MSRLSVVIMTVGLCCVLTGCSGSSDQLERVAKDWCLTLRASQILPVYPLTEDLQPGDVFVVQTPLAKQTDIYKKKGFLPLDQLATRLFPPGAYSQFYKDAYLKGTYGEVVPHPRPVFDPSKTDGPDSATAALLPMAGFPTYNFQVVNGGGLQIAVPIQAVPVGLAFLNAQRATGTVTLSGAYTYGMDIQPVYSELMTWLKSPGVLPTLTAVTRQIDREIYLRVINRVYLVHSVNVDLQSQDSFGFGADVATPQPVNLPPIVGDKGPVSPSTNYTEYLKALNEQLKQSKIWGGSVRILHAAGRQISLEQNFSRPLAIGYLGFDVMITKEGQVSAPIPSFALLNANSVEPDPKKVVNFQQMQTDPLRQAYFTWLKEKANTKAMEEWLTGRGFDIASVPAWSLAFDPKYDSLLREANAKFNFYNTHE